MDKKFYADADTNADADDNGIHPKNNITPHPHSVVGGGGGGVGGCITTKTFFHESKQLIEMSARKQVLDIFLVACTDHSMVPM